MNLLRRCASASSRWELECWNQGSEADNIRPVAPAVSGGGREDPPPRQAPSAQPPMIAAAIARAISASSHSKRRSAFSGISALLEPTGREVISRWVNELFGRGKKMPAALAPVSLAHYDSAPYRNRRP